MRRHFRLGRKITAALLSAALVAVVLAAGVAAPADDDALIAKSLAEMLRAGRTVISSNQSRINDPALGDKGLGGQAVLQQAMKIYQTSTGTDPASIDPASRHGKLLRAEMDAIVAVMDANQVTINAPGTAFKGFIPAVFGRLVSEEFEKHAQGAGPDQGDGAGLSGAEPQGTAQRLGERHHQVEAPGAGLAARAALRRGRRDATGGRPSA